MSRYFLLKLFLTCEYFSAIQDLPVFSVTSLYLPILPWRIRSRPLKLHIQLFYRFFKRTVLFRLIIVIYEFRPVVYLDSLYLESHSLSQALYEFLCLVCALLFYYLQHSLPAVFIYRRYLIILISWMYPKKVDKCVRIRDKKKQKGKTHMPNKNSPTKYSEEFKKTIVTLYQSGKTYAEIKKEYGVSSSALSNWVRKYSQVQVDEDTVLTAQQIKALQRRNAELEEENLILKKAIAIFTPHSDRD